MPADAITRRASMRLCAGIGGSLATVGRLAAASPAFAGQSREPRPDSREAWLVWVERVAGPVLRHLEAGTLRATMPVEAVAGHEAERRVGTHLEAFARLLAGLAPWLELPEDGSSTPAEEALRVRFRRAAQAAIRSALDPASPDYMQFGKSGQTLVDSSFLSLALLRAPRQLLQAMSSTTRAHLVAALEAERTVLPPFNNWLLFAAMNEALLRRLGSAWDRLRVDYALRELQSWYVGDGVYGDGPRFHADFYNSYVMQPYLLALSAELEGEAVLGHQRAEIVTRAQRYAAIQERTVAADGSFPPIGRSITYRAGAFHLLADVSLRGLLPPHLEPGAVRAALGAVQERTLAPPETFSREGWLRIGLAGHQPSLAETYISTGSLYLCSMAWLPLGLPATDAFWTAPAQDWTQKKVWAGMDVAADHAIGE